MATPGNLQVPSGLAQAEASVLTPEALAFLERLHHRFEPQRDLLLRARRVRMRELAAGGTLDFLPETAHVRDDDWTVAPIPADLRERRVEITGPVERKMVINALNSGADCFMADFEDSNSPTWSNVIEGQENLRDAVDGVIEYTAPGGKHYVLDDDPATLLVRPRGWHLPERNACVDGRPMSGSLFDFGLFFFHNARKLLERGSGPYFYLPKLESHLEARLWNDVFVAAQDDLGIPRGSIRATVLIETLPAAFEMDEILYELRDHSAGLNCGRWDYIFSIIKTRWNEPDCVFPDRSRVTMTTHCMRSYSLLLIQTCHRRGIHAMGGMAAQIPIRDDARANEVALAKVREDKVREASDGHDGTWVAHPGLVATAQAAFKEHMPGQNQIRRLREDITVTREDLLEVPEGPVTEAGVRHNINVCLRYMAAWLSGNGCVPLDHLMEDAATAEISRSQLWQWLHHGVRLEDGRLVTHEWLQKCFDDEESRLTPNVEVVAPSRIDLARSIIETTVDRDTFTEFMTSIGYDHLVGPETKE